jgi:subtilisin-like proprotein convertase family protein
MRLDMKRFHLNTLVALAALLPAAAWAQTYTAGPGLALAVPDDGYNGTQGSMGCSTIAVASGGGGGDTVATTTVQVAMSHTWIGDLTIKLISPAGTPITLVSRPGLVEPADDGTGCCGDSSNLAIGFPLTYDDAAPNSAETMGGTIGTNDVVCQTDSLCNFSPAPGAATAGNLGSLNGQSKVGNWQLCLGDSGGGDLGTLDGWTLTLGTTPVELQNFSID